VRRVIFILLLMLLMTAIIYAIEANDYIGLSKYKPVVEIGHSSNEYIITWSKIPYLVYYEIEILNYTAGQNEQPSSAIPEYRLAKYSTFNNTIKIDQEFPESACVRVSAHSLFHHPLGSYSDLVPLAEMKPAAESIPLKPVALTMYPPDDPAPNIPLLQWTIPPGSIYYEIEFLTAPAENPNGIAPSIYQFNTSREVFVNGYSIDLSAYPGDHLYWRVRGLDLNGNPVGVFSDAAPLYIDHTLPQILKPVSNTGYKKANVPMPLYPVYAWFPVYGAIYYEVELTTAPPENPNGISPSQFQLRRHMVKGITDCYDDEALSTPGTYYWRVRGLDASGSPIGVYSDAEEFTVSHMAGSYAATLGDSITHGGGDMSYSPANVEYSFQTYLSFPAMNLGKSADTTETMLNRFDDDVLPYHPRFLIIMGGTDSLRGGVPADQVITELAAIRDKCLLHDIRPIFLTLPPINPEAIIRAFNEVTVPNWQEEFAAVNSFIREQQYYIDIEPDFLDADHNLPARYAVDGMHPNIEGKKLMAQIINANWARVTQ
jgi:lysophospholipase L1-like esterase